MSENGEKSEERKDEKPHVCTVCARPADTTICHACEDKLRGEALEKKRDIEKM
ncbi:MAG: hypothetical protein V3T30_02255 [Thermodesulfobacteriota bacterium]